MATPHHEQVRSRRFARLILGAAGANAVSALTQRPPRTSTTPKPFSANAQPSSAFSSPNMGNDQSPVSTREYEQAQTPG